MKHTTLELPNEDHSEGALLFLLLVLVLAVCAVIAEAAQPRASGESDSSAGAGNMLILVREWDPESGPPICWLPIHRAAIHLQIMDKPLPKHFDLNDAVHDVRVPRPGPASENANSWFRLRPRFRMQASATPRARSKPRPDREAVFLDP